MPIFVPEGGTERGRLYCAACGGSLVVGPWEEDEGMRSRTTACPCGQTSILHIDGGMLDLALLEPVDSDDFEIFGPPAA